MTDEILNIILKILLIVLSVLSLMIALHTLYTSRKTFKKDQEFWAHLDEEIEKSRKQYQLYLDEHPEEDVENEQTKDQN